MSLPVKVVKLILKFHPRVVTVPDIQSTDEKIRSRRERFGMYELFVWVLAWKEGRLVLARKADEWGGGWTLLGGAVEADEEVEAGAIREAKEESGLDVALRPPAGVIQSKLVSPNDQFDYFLVLFEADVIRGKIEPEDKREIAEAKLVQLEELLQLASEGRFPRIHPSIDQAILECFRLTKNSKQSS